MKLCFDTKIQRKAAMKIINKAKLKKLFAGKNVPAYKQLENEIAIMKKMWHPNIVQLYEIIDDPSSNKIYIVMEYIPGGTLLSKIKVTGKLTPDFSRKYFRELIAGLYYCHEVAGIIHRDIKPENLLLGEDGQVRLADFGIAFMMENGSDQATATLGSALFIAPEICNGRSYKGRQTDIWAAGVTLYYMYTGTLPFNGSGLGQLYEQIINKP